MTTVAALTLAASLAWAGLTKLFRLRTFVEHIVGYRLLNYSSSRLVAAPVVVAELLCAALLLVPATRWMTALAAALLLMTFVGIQLSAVVRHLDIPCGCFGMQPGSELVGPASLVRTIELMALALWVLIGPVSHFSLGYALLSPLLGLMLLIASSGANLFLEIWVRPSSLVPEVATGVREVRA